MDKNIEMEAKKNKAALDYFKEIENIENKYLEQKLLKISAMDTIIRLIKIILIKTKSFPQKN